MDNIIHLIFNSPTKIALKLGTIIKEDEYKVTMNMRNSTYVYVKNEDDIGKFFSNIRTFPRR